MDLCLKMRYTIEERVFGENDPEVGRHFRTEYERTHCPSKMAIR